MFKARDLEERHKAVSENLNTAIKTHSILTREQKMALARALDGFVSSLVLQATSAQLDTLNADGWEYRDQWTQAQWQYWETFGWYGHFHFCRNVGGNSSSHELKEF